MIHAHWTFDMRGCCVLGNSDPGFADVRTPCIGTLLPVTTGAPVKGTPPTGANWVVGGTKELAPPTKPPVTTGAPT